MKIKQLQKLKILKKGTSLPNKIYFLQFFQISDSLKQKLAKLAKKMKPLDLSLNEKFLIDYLNVIFSYYNDKF